MAQTRVPALRVMENALAATAENGHENEGSLSYSHGFLPVTPPILALPASHAAWDQVANSTAEMMRTYSVRRRLEEMPLLSASVEDLPDEYLLRASSMFSIFAHLYWYAQPDEPTNGLPSQMQQPWEEISRRLDRPAPHLSFIDLKSYNWKFIDPQAEQPFMVDNLELVVPMMGNEDERRFQMVPVEFLYEVRPVLQAVIHAQEAVRDNNIDVLKETLVQVGDLLKRLTYGTFMKVDPNIYSGRT